MLIVTSSVPRSAVPAALCAAFAVATPAQDMIGVTYSGTIYAIDSQSGATTLVGAGLFGQNGLARDDQGQLWTVSRNLLGTPHYWLVRIDPATFAVQAVAPCQDLRALADAGNGELYAIEFLPGNGMLVRLDTATGARTPIGITGQRIEGLAVRQGTLYGFSATAGLGTLDPMTGVFTDLGPAPGSSEVLWLATRPDGQLVGGGYSFYTFDVATGVGTPYAAGSVVFTGVEPTGMAISYGQGCAGVVLTAGGALLPGTVLTTRSTGHPSTGAVVGTGGALILGASRTVYQGVALPLLLDPLLGTSGCSLYASVDVTAIDFTTGGPAPSLWFATPIPPGVANQTFYLQHMSFDFTGATRWSNGIQVHIGL